MPVARVPAFLAAADAAVERAVPGARIVAFGHLGDGNIHYNVSQPLGADKAAFLGQWEAVNRIVHDIALGLDGTFSAEHGIGQLKRDELARGHVERHAAQGEAGPEIGAMRAIKAALDPYGILNPGKVV